MKFSNSEIKDLAKALHENNLTSLSYSQGDCSITLQSNVDSDVSMSSTHVPTSDLSDRESTKVETIKCPLIGHFYLTATPDSEPFVKCGDRIEIGDVIGVLQAMKVSNEIKSDVSGIVENILVESGQFVDYDCALIEVKV